MFSFSKLIYLRKRYKLSSTGNKFPSCLILLFVNAENSLVNVNHPLFCFAHLPRSLSNFLFTSAWSLLMASLLHFLGEQLGCEDPLPAHWNKCICSFLPWPSCLLQISLIWCWKQFSLIQFEDHLQQVCLLIPPSFFKSSFCLFYRCGSRTHLSYIEWTGLLGLGLQNFNCFLFFAGPFQS